MPGDVIYHHRFQRTPDTEVDTWDRAVTRAFVTRWNDGATAEDAFLIWLAFMDQRRHTPADAAPEVWQWLWALFLRTEGVRGLDATHRDGAA